MFISFVYYYYHLSTLILPSILFFSYPCSVILMDENKSIIYKYTLTYINIDLLTKINKVLANFNNHTYCKGINKYDFIMTSEMIDF